MSFDTEVRYLLDRMEIQDLIATYGLGQDLHQPPDENQDILEEWSRVFAPDAVIDTSAGGGPGSMNLESLAELMRGRGLKGGTNGLGAVFSKWQHREGHAVVTLSGDTATALTPFLHLHEVRADGSQLIHSGTWIDRLERRPEGWRIVHRGMRHAFFQRFATIPLPEKML
jgi:hypothetical protein